MARILTELHDFIGTGDTRIPVGVADLSKRELELLERALFGIPRAHPGGTCLPPGRAGRLGGRPDAGRPVPSVPCHATQVQISALYPFHQRIRSPAMNGRILTFVVPRRGT